MEHHQQKVDKTSRSKIDSLEHFKQEFAALHDQLDRHIKNAAQYERVEMSSASNELINNLNRLKLHRSKLKEMLNSFEGTSEEAWIEIRPFAEEVFEKAEEAAREINRGLI